MRYPEVDGGRVLRAEPEARRLDEEVAVGECRADRIDVGDGKRFGGYLQFGSEGGRFVDAAVGDEEFFRPASGDAEGERPGGAAAAEEQHGLIGEFHAEFETHRFLEADAVGGAPGEFAAGEDFHG